MTPHRPAPAITPITAPFWTGGADGKLRILRCQSCLWWLHPPLPLCPRCQGRVLTPEVVSGSGTIWSYTTSQYSWGEGLEAPYVVASIELAEQPGLRLLSAIVDCDDVAIGMPVRVRFEQTGDAWVPVFAP